MAGERGSVFQRLDFNLYCGNKRAFVKKALDTLISRCFRYYTTTVNHSRVFDAGCTAARDRAA